MVSFYGIFIIVTDINYAFCLIALAVETVSGMGIEEYVQQNIFIPLGMDESSWMIANVDTNNVAMPMYYEAPNYRAFGHVSHPLWPVGTLRTSAVQLAKHLALISPHLYIFFPCLIKNYIIY